MSGEAVNRPVGSPVPQALSALAAADELRAGVVQLDRDLDAARSDGTIFTYGQIQRRLRALLDATAPDRAPSTRWTAEQRVALAREFAAARSGREHVDFYVAEAGPMWQQALREADRALAAMELADPRG